MTSPEEKPSVTDAEMLESWSGPAIHSNRFISTRLGSGIRLAFMEQHGERMPAQFRAAVFMEYGDVAALLNLLQEQLLAGITNQNDEKPNGKD